MPSLPRTFTSDGGAPARRRSAAHAARSTSRLLAALERLYREADWVARADLDAIRYPLRYPDAADREIVGLLAACMAYGRVDLFGPWVEWTLARMGESPARFVRGFDLAKHGRMFDGFHYRFNRARDVLAFCLAVQRILVRRGIAMWGRPSSASWRASAGRTCPPSSRATASPTATGTGSLVPPPAAPASACTSTCAGW